MADLEAQARDLYAQGTRSAPAWSQLGEVTKQVWREHAQRYLDGDPRWWSVLPQEPAAQQQEKPR